jgi:hypothetical protein
MCYSALTLFECFLSGLLIKNFVPKFLGEALLYTEYLCIYELCIIDIFLMIIFDV